MTITTRYPHDAARRFAAEADFEALSAPRLRIERIDFRDIRAVHAFLDAELRRDEALDILINQAARTIRASATLERVEKERDRVAALGSGGPATLVHVDHADPDALLVATRGAVVRDRDITASGST